MDTRLRELEKACRKAGARVTHQRREVLRAVVETDVHPDAQSVLQRVRQRMPTISFDTVYRTLSFLEQHNLISRVHATGERTRFDGNHALHHHFICAKCGKIIDFESKQLDEMELPGGSREPGNCCVTTASGIGDLPGLREIEGGEQWLKSRRRNS
ncbi:Fur family transcriptional regulator [Candidatus Bipolaricaulota bacterium]